jgi:hypothetical protein
VPIDLTPHLDPVRLLSSRDQGEHMMQQ